MEQQFEQPAASLAKTKNSLPLMIILNVVVAALVSLAISYFVVAAATKPFTNRITTLEQQTTKQLGQITVLEQQLAKITSVYHVGK
jgi:hypothetical protein